MKAIFFRDDFIDTLDLSYAHQVILGLVSGDLKTETQRTHNIEDLNQLDLTGMSALHWAAWREDVDAIRELLRAGADVDVLTSLQMTPLCEAARRRSAKSIKELILGGADRTIRDTYGYTALHHGLLMDSPRDDTAWLESLVPNTTQLAKMNIPGSSIIGCCAQNNLVQCGRFLIRLGADINELDNVGSLPLFDAIIKEAIEFVQLLLDNGVRYDRTNSQGLTILHVMAVHGSPASAAILTKARLKGLDVDAKDHQGLTAKECLARRVRLPHGFEKAFESLVESVHTADISGNETASKPEIFHDALEVQAEPNDLLPQKSPACGNET